MNHPRMDFSPVSKGAGQSVSASGRVRSRIKTNSGSGSKTERTATGQWRDPSWPELSISVIVYNQVEFVGRALDSILRQRVNFSYEIIVGDDCSDDGTQEVLRDYQRRYPDRIQLILHPRRYRNVPGRINNLCNLHACRGKYTALLDGDDFWTDPHKLQRQYDRMENNPNLSMCCHDSYLLYEDDPLVPTADTPTVGQGGRIRQSGIYGHRTVAEPNELKFHIASIFYRTRIFREFPVWFETIIPADYALVLLISQCGPFYYDARPQGVYFQNRNSFIRWAYNDRSILEQRIRDVSIFSEHFPEVARSKNQHKVKAWMHYRMFKLCLRARDYARGFHHLRKMMQSDAGYPKQLLVNAVWKKPRRLPSA